MMLIKFLMYQINSIDGNKDSAESMFQNLYNKFKR